jgi:hypothetical protein
LVEPFLSLGTSLVRLEGVDWVGIGDGGTAWNELGIEMTKRTKEKDEKVFGGDSREDAGRSLRLLRRAKPGHPLCPPQTVGGAGTGLLWREREADA